MIVYNATKRQFLQDSYTNSIEEIIVSKFDEVTHKKVTKSEINSWKNSLVHMERVLNNHEIPDNSGICIEYHIPRTNNRIDFIVTGQNEHKIDHALLIELKQWSSAEITDQDSIVRTMMNSHMVETTHPSYQAWSYASLMNGFNSTIYTENIQLKPCAYLHNYKTDDVITNAFYSEYIEKAPIFLKNDLLKLQNFIKSYIKHGDDSNIISRIDHGKIKPSKSLSDSLKGMLKGNQEFVMIDNQKVVYEAALALAQKSGKTNKNVLIVKGGPGTGKSVVAINLLAKMNYKGLHSLYVTRNSAPRSVYASKLTGTFKKN